jgi:hypothetical protein
MSETPAEGSADGVAPVTEVQESDPNADSADGLAGDMGVSSERRGPVRGHDGEVTYAAAPPSFDNDPADGEAPPEQSAHDGRPDANPESPGPHTSDPESNPGHGV